MSKGFEKLTRSTLDSTGGAVLALQGAGTGDWKGQRAPQNEQKVTWHFPLPAGRTDQFLRN